MGSILWGDRGKGVCQARTARTRSLSHLHCWESGEAVCVHSGPTHQGRAHPNNTPHHYGTWQESNQVINQSDLRGRPAQCHLFCILMIKRGTEQGGLLPCTRQHNAGRQFGSRSGSYSHNRHSHSSLLYPSLQPAHKEALSSLFRWGNRLKEVHAACLRIC